MPPKPLSVEAILKKLATQGIQPVSWLIQENELTEVTVRINGELRELDIDQIWGML